MYKKNRTLGARMVLTLGLLCGWTTTCAADLPDTADESDALTGLNQFLLPREDLGEVRAREGTTTFEQMNQSDQRAWLEQNRLQSHMTGNNVMHEAAMRVEGIGSVIQNTGNQVIIQDITQINLSITP